MLSAESETVSRLSPFGCPSLKCSCPEIFLPLPSASVCSVFSVVRLPVPPSAFAYSACFAVSRRRFPQKSACHKRSNFRQKTPSLPARYLRASLLSSAPLKKAAEQSRPQAKETAP